MHVNGNAIDWTMEQVFAGERLYCALQLELAEAVDLTISQVPEAGTLSLHETTGIMAHGLMEAAMRLIMAAKMPCSMLEFMNAAGYVYRSCHANDEKHGDAHTRQ